MIDVHGNSVIFGSSDGMVAKYQIMGTHVVPSDLDILISQKVDSAVMSLSMDD